MFHTDFQNRPAIQSGESFQSFRIGGECIARRIEFL